MMNMVDYSIPVNKQELKKDLLLKLLLIYSCALLMALSSQVKIPLFFTPVPITLQTFTLFASIIILRRSSLWSIVVWILLGIAGMPVFTQGGGIAALTGATAGYIFGFLVTAVVLPPILAYIENRENFFWPLVFSFMLVNVFVIYGFGVLWLIIMLSLDPGKAIMLGVLPFIVGDTIKILVVAALSSRLMR